MGRKKDNFQETNPQISSISSDIVHSKRVRRSLLRRRLAIVAAIILIALLAVTGVAYWLMNMVERNSMMITIDRENLKTFTLSKDDTFEEQTSVLNIKGPESLDEIAFEEVYPKIQEALAENKEGEFHGKNYIAFAFYIRNTSENVDDYVNFVEKITLPTNTQNIGYALRLFLAESETDGTFKEENQHIYGMASEDGSPNKISLQSFTDREGNVVDIADATPFESDSVICTRQMKMKGGEVKRIVVFVWCEGTFTEDSMEYGQISVGFTFTAE